MVLIVLILIDLQYFWIPPMITLLPILVNHWYKKMWLTPFDYGMRYTRKLAATMTASIKIVITIPFLVVLFFFSGMSLFCDKD